MHLLFLKFYQKRFEAIESNSVSLQFMEEYFEDKPESDDAASFLIDLLDCLMLETSLYNTFQKLVCIHVEEDLVCNHGHFQNAKEYSFTPAILDLVDNSTIEDLIN